MAGAARTARARRSQARQGAARSASRGHPDLPARPAAVCQPGVPGADGLSEPACAGRCRRPRRALCRTGRVERLLDLGHRHAGEDFRDPARRHRCAAIGGRRPPLHDFMGRRFRPRLDLLEHAPGGRSDRGCDLRSNAGGEAEVSEPDVDEPDAHRTVGGRPSQRRRTRRHPRHHGRWHRDVRRRGQHQFGQSQRRSAVRL